MVRGSRHTDAGTFSPDPCTRTGPRVPGQLGEEAGWSHALVRLLADGTLPPRPLAPLHRVLAVPEAVAETAESLVRSWSTPASEYGAE